MTTIEQHEVHVVTDGSSDRSEKAEQLLSMGLNMFGPLALHSGLTRHGMSEVNALMISGSLPLIGLSLDRLRGRRMNGLGILTLAGIALSLVLGLVTRDARVVLLEGALNSLLAGLACLGFLFARRTVVEVFMVGAMGGEDTPRGARICAALSQPQMRRFVRSLNVVFAVVFLVSATAQAALAWWANPSIAFAYNRFGFIPSMVIMMVAAVVLYRRADARGDFEGMNLRAQLF